MDGFHDLVSDAWNNDGIIETNGMISFKKKLQHIKHVIREWVASKRLESLKLKSDHQKRLAEIDVKIDNCCATDEDLSNRRDSMQILGDLDRREANDFAQKSKIKWATDGDENSKFFHGMLKRRRSQLAITGILKNGDWIDDPTSVKAEFYDHFRNRFLPPSGIPPSLNVDMPNILSNTQRDFLEHKCTREEIKKAVWDCGSDRAPGPDGFTFKFITSFWDLLEADVGQVVDDVAKLLIGWDEGEKKLTGVKLENYVWDVRKGSLVIIAVYGGNGGFSDDRVFLTAHGIGNGVRVLASGMILGAVPVLIMVPLPHPLPTAFSCLNRYRVVDLFMAKFNIYSQNLFFISFAILLIMASMSLPSLSRPLSSSYSSMVLDHLKGTHDANSTSLSHSTNRAEFEANAHEVPMGPNPISNNLVG
ncbi:hypothetical protein Tco_0695931 [Tanacetum coccineum]